LHAIGSKRVSLCAAPLPGVARYKLLKVTALDKDQYTGKGLTRVQTKGGVMRDFVPVHREARQVLEEWLEAQQDASPPLFLTRTGSKLSRREAYGIIRRVAAQANAHLPEDEKRDVSPRVLRHTFLRKLAETKGVHYAREASGH